LRASILSGEKAHRKLWQQPKAHQLNNITPRQTRASLVITHTRLASISASYYFKMNTRTPVEAPNSTLVLSITFNDDCSCFAVGLNTGFCSASSLRSLMSTINTDIPQYLTRTHVRSDQHVVSLFCHDSIPDQLA
jgi:hypothetical protein